MEKLLFIIIGILLLMIFVLAAKVYFLRKSAQEIAEAFHDRVTADTNTLIDISSRDRHMRRLAADINTQLRLLRKERHRYQQGDLELKEAVANISHDLRTPLTAIRGYLDLLEREKTSEPVAQGLACIRERTDALTGLTGELFCYTLSATPQRLKPERVDLVRMLEESLLSFYAAMQEKGICPQLDLPEDAVWRQLDRGAVQRVFSNLIANALKYSDGDFSVRMTTDGSIFFTNRAKKLDAVTVGRLFDRYYTVEAGKREAGLGLNIAKTLTRRMGGTLEAALDGETLCLRLHFAP